MIKEVKEIAEEEIDKAVIEAGKEVAAQISGDSEYYKTLSFKWMEEAENLKEENMKITKNNRWMKRGLYVTGGISLGSIAFALLTGLAK